VGSRSIALGIMTQKRAQSHRGVPRKGEHRLTHHIHLAVCHAHERGEPSVDLLSGRTVVGASLVCPIDHLREVGDAAPRGPREGLRDLAHREAVRSGNVVGHAAVAYSQQHGDRTSVTSSRATAATRLSLAEARMTPSELTIQERTSM
jgi:hypothetical protein